MNVLHDLLKLKFVKEAKGTFGYYDILVKLAASTDKEIRKIKNVSTTTTISVIPEQDGL